MSTARTYLDYNATAPLREEARAAVIAALDAFGNPSSVHSEGRRARALVEGAREQVAALVGAKPAQVVFTSGATEANAWVLSAAQKWDAVLLSQIEHDSVLDTAANSGARIVDVAVGRSGAIDVGSLARLSAEPAPNKKRSLIALQMANNETGVLQPVTEAAAIAGERGAALHVDAVQACGRVPIDFAGLGATTMSLSAHKMGGPKGVGALVVRDDTDLVSLVTGGGQERRRRAGTENVAALVGFGAAAEVCAREAGRCAGVEALRDELEQRLLAATPDATVIGADAARLANTSCVAVPGKLSETLVIRFDLAGIAISAGAACSSGKVGRSRVLQAMGLEPQVARGAVRISIGHGTTRSDIERFLAVWADVVGSKALAA